MDGAVGAGGAERVYGGGDAAGAEPRGAGGFHRGMDGAPDLREAVPVFFLRNPGAHDAAGHRAVPGQRADPGHRPGHGHADREAVRGGNPGGAFGAPGAADGDSRHRPQTDGHDRRELRGAAGGPEGPDLPAELRDSRDAGGSDREILRGPDGGHRSGKPLPAVRRPGGSRVQDGGPDRHRPGGGAGQRQPGALRHEIHPAGNGGLRGARVPAGGGAVPLGLGAAAGAGGAVPAGPDFAAAFLGADCGGGRGPGEPADLPAGILAGGAGNGPADPGADAGHPAGQVCRGGEGGIRL